MATALPHPTPEQLTGITRMVLRDLYGDPNQTQEVSTMQRIAPKDAPPHVWHRIAEDANRDRHANVREVEAHEILDLLEQYIANKNDGMFHDYKVNMRAIVRLARTYGMEV